MLALLYVTTSETKNSFLLLEIFERVFNPNENGHLVAGGLFYLSVLVEKEWSKGGVTLSMTCRDV